MKIIKMKKLIIFLGATWMSMQTAYATEAYEQLLENLPEVIEEIQKRNESIEKQIRSLSGETVTEASNDTNNATDTAHYANQKREYYQPYQAGVRDPFTPTSAIEFAPSGANFTQLSPTESVMSMPKLTLKGVTYKDNPTNSIALLDVAGDGVHMVRIGDEISINPMNPQEVLKIRKINRLSLVVEFGTLGDLIIVR